MPMCTAGSVRQGPGTMQLLCATANPDETVHVCCSQVFEAWLHPSKFCTVMCTEGLNCKRKVCWFAHSPAELRVPSASSAQLPATAPGMIDITATAVPASPTPYLPMGSSSSTSSMGSALPRVRAASCSGMTSSSNSTSSNLYSNSGSSAGSSTSSTLGSSSSYYVRKTSISPLHTPVPSFPLSGQSSSQHSPVPVGHSSCTSYVPELQPQVAHLSPASSNLSAQLPGLPQAVAPTALLPLADLHLQQHAQQTASALSAPLQVLTGLTGLNGLTDCSPVPVSIMPMLASPAADEAVMLNPALNPLTGLLTSLEEQAWHAQLQAANAQAAAAAASSNLQAVLSALGGLSIVQPAAACGSPHEAVLAQLSVDSLAPTTAGMYCSWR